MSGRFLSQLEAACRVDGATGDAFFSAGCLTSRMGAGLYEIELAEALDGSEHVPSILPRSAGVFPNDYVNVDGGVRKLLMLRDGAGTLTDSDFYASWRRIQPGDGVASIPPPPLPAPLSINDLTNMTATTFPLFTLGGGQQRITAFASDTNSAALGSLGTMRDGAAGTPLFYIDGSVNNNPLATHVFVDVSNPITTNAITIPASAGITLTFNGALSPLTLQNIKPILLAPTTVLGNVNFKRFFLDVAGLMYLSAEFVDGVQTLAQLDYPMAVAMGPF